MVGNGVGVCARGVSLAHTVPGHGPSTLTPARLRIHAAPGFSVLGFQPRLLGNHTVTSRTDVTTVYHRTRYPGPIVDPRNRAALTLRRPRRVCTRTRDVDFGNRSPRSCRNDNAE